MQRSRTSSLGTEAPPQPISLVRTGCIRPMRAIRKLPACSSTPSDSALKTERVIVVLAIAALSACRTGRMSNVPTAPAEPPHLTATTFVAYGDSITEGFVQRCPGNEPEKEPTDKEPTGKEPSDKEPSDKEPSEKQATP